jgi:hypothetical protein
VQLKIKQRKPIPGLLRSLHDLSPIPEWTFRLKGDHDKIGDSPGLQRVFMTSNSVPALDATITFAGGGGPGCTPFRILIAKFSLLDLLA